MKFIPILNAQHIHNINVVVNLTYPLNMTYKKYRAFANLAYDNFLMLFKDLVIYSCVFALKKKYFYIILFDVVEDGA